MKALAIVGSSGGNLFSLGGKEPQKLLGEILTQAKSAEFNVSHIVFIGATSSMDNIKPSTKASLYEIDGDSVAQSNLVSLQEANDLAVIADKKLATAILNNEVDGLIIMSADPKKTNAESIKAAVKMNIPIVGTGGTSMANIQSLGAKVISVSGTTGTTNRTRAVSAITSFAKHFKVKYHPVIGQAGGSSQSSSRLRDRISFRGIMLAAIPGFIAMALALAISKIPFLAEHLSPVSSLLIGALPVLVATIAAKQVSGLDEVGIVAGIITGVLSTKSGVLGGIIGGILAGILASYLIKKAIEWKIPGTTANIIAGGIAGLIVGLFVYFLLSPVTLFLGNGIRSLITTSLEFSPILAGVLAGLLIWPAIISGVYHAAILPLVLLEMEAEGMSFLGAIDMVGLVMVSAGITLGFLLFPRNKADRAIAGPGFLINMGFGTFVEAAYPFMFSNKLILATAIISSGFGGFLIGLFNIKGTAYLPSIIAPAMSNNVVGFIISMLGSMLMALVLTFITNRIINKGVKINDK